MSLTVPSYLVVGAIFVSAFILHKIKSSGTGEFYVMEKVSIRLLTVWLLQLIDVCVSLLSRTYCLYGLSRRSTLNGVDWGYNAFALLLAPISENLKFTVPEFIEIDIVSNSKSCSRNMSYLYFIYLCCWWMRGVE